MWHCLVWTPSSLTSLVAGGTAWTNGSIKDAQLSQLRLPKLRVQWLPLKPSHNSSACSGAPGAVNPQQETQLTCLKKLL